MEESEQKLLEWIERSNEVNPAAWMKTQNDIYTNSMQTCGGNSIDIIEWIHEGGSPGQG